MEILIQWLTITVFLKEKPIVKQEEVKKEEIRQEEAKQEVKD